MDNANAGYGVVVACFDSDNKDAASAIVYQDQSLPLCVLPRRLFDVDKLKGQGYSTNQIKKLAQELNIGANIQFQAVGNQIVSYERFSKGQEWIKMDDNFTLIGDKCISLCVKGIVSDEQVRRFYCYDFDSTDRIPIPNVELRKLVPNVVYELNVHVNMDFHGYQADQPSELCNPTFTLSFGRWLRPLKGNFNEIGRAPWNLVPRRMQVRYNTPSHVILAAEPIPVLEGTPCLVIDDKELFCAICPFKKCLMAVIRRDDMLLRVGCLLFCEMFYSYHNDAYIIYNYWHGQFSIENPMKARVTDRGSELAFVKLNRYGHFFCSSSIPLITDPNNILHGYVEIGDDNLITDEIEQEHGRGIPVWVNYSADKTDERTPSKFEVVALAGKESSVDGQGNRIIPKKSFKPFTSTGFMLNKRGNVYCPHVCNFPIVWADPQVDVGSLFKFKAKFNKAAQHYEVMKMLKLINPCPYDTVKLSMEEDAYAFRIPLMSNMTFTTHLLLDKDCMGFVEELESLNGSLAAFARIMARIKPGQKQMVWCRENTNLALRITPLICFGFEQPEGQVIDKSRRCSVDGSTSSSNYNSC